MKKAALTIVLLASAWPTGVAAEPLAVDRGFHHLRVDGPREWGEFPESPEAERLEIGFDAEANRSEWTLQLRQQDVKGAWNVSLNGKRLGRLTRDENDMVVYFKVPLGAVQAGENKLLVAQSGGQPDDVRVGQISLHSCTLDEVVNDGVLEVEVVDAQQNTSLPARITIVDENGSLQTVGAESNDQLAIRAGTVYTSTGQATFGLPAGEYTIYAGRGFEYSLAKRQISVAKDDKKHLQLSIRRVVDTAGYVACDTHVHTLTHSGHGDATARERMITLVGEGIELPIGTDHNKHIDHAPLARELNVDRYFTPVIGNEVTTPTGHFNIFPVHAGAPIPDYKATDWKTILAGVYRTPGVKIAILNHARDIHSGVRPFGPKLFNDAVGENLEDWAMDFNAMEVVNSGATQTDPMQLFYDWMALLNRGYSVTPVGSSDSHDVARHFVGQGRTYIRCADGDPGNINVAAAVESFLAGRVLVSYGLLTELKVDGKHRSGDLAPGTAGEIQVAVDVRGPEWTDARKVVLYANGHPIREAAFPRANRPAGVKGRIRWTIPRPKHDVHLVAIATGPGIEGPFWRTAKPYQPKSDEPLTQVLGCSGAVWIDADGDGKKTSAREYAENIFRKSGGDLPKLVELLGGYDRAVAAQAAHLVQSSSKPVLSDEVEKAFAQGTEAAQAGFRDYVQAWRATQLARIEP